MNPSPQQIIESFEKKFDAYRYSNELLDKISPDELEQYLQALADSTQKPDYSSTLIRQDGLKKFPPEWWFPVCRKILNNLPFVYKDIPYSYFEDYWVIVPQPDGTEEKVSRYHPVISFLSAAVEQSPDLWKDEFEMLFRHEIILFGQTEKLFYKKYAPEHYAFFKEYTNRDPSVLNLKRAIVVMLLSDNESLKQLAVEKIGEKFNAEELKWLNLHNLRGTGYEFKNGTLRELYPRKPFHIIFPDGFLDVYIDDEDESYQLLHAVSPAYPWGGIKTIQKPNGKKLHLHHIITLDPIPVNLPVTSVKKLEIVVDLSTCSEDGTDDFYWHTEEGTIRIEDETYWIYDGMEDYFPSAAAFKTCTVQLSDQGEQYAIQEWTKSGNIHRVGGYPSFVQDTSFPECPDCKETMPMIIQLNSDIPLEDGSQYSWGSGGVAHIYWCDKCRVSAINWECT